jgi:hypothetical protein
MPFSGYIANDIDAVVTPQFQLLKTAQSATAAITIPAATFAGAYNNTGAAADFTFTLEAPSQVSYGEYAIFTATEAKVATVSGNLTYNGVAYTSAILPDRWGSVVLYSDGLTFHVLNTSGTVTFA